MDRSLDARLIGFALGALVGWIALEPYSFYLARHYEFQLENYRYFAYVGMPALCAVIGLIFGVFLTIVKKSWLSFSMLGLAIGLICSRIFVKEFLLPMESERLQNLVLSFYSLPTTQNLNSVIQLHASEVGRICQPLPMSNTWKSLIQLKTISNTEQMLRSGLHAIYLYGAFTGALYGLLCYVIKMRWFRGGLLGGAIGSMLGWLLLYQHFLQEIRLTEIDGKQIAYALAQIEACFTAGLYGGGIGILVGAILSFWVVGYQRKRLISPYGAALSVVALIVFLYPMALTGGMNVNLYAYPPQIRNQLRIACLFSSSSSSWATVHYEVRLKGSLEWQEGPLEGFFDIDLFGYRSRLNRIILASKKTSSKNTKKRKLYGKNKLRLKELADYIAQKWHELNPEDPSVAEVQFWKVFHPVGEEHCMAYGPWTRPKISDIRAQRKESEDTIKQLEKERDLLAKKALEPRNKKRLATIKKELKIEKHRLSKKLSTIFDYEKFKIENDCSDEIDNDRDKKVDCDDANCFTDPACANSNDSQGGK